MAQHTKPVIYQLLPRLFTNYNPSPIVNGPLTRNGSGKLNAITDTVLASIRDLGTTHVWYTGVIEHAHNADYTAYGIPRHNPHIIKGHAGSPYAITDYYDIDPDLAEDVPGRIAEFEALVERTHRAGMKVIIDFVPNHVARQYHSDAKPAGIEDLGQGDNKDMFFCPTNNFYYIPRQQFAPVGVDLGAENDEPYIEFPAKASGNDCFTAFPGKFDWYDTAKLNYGIDPGNGTVHFDPIPPTWLKMLHILRYWAAKGVDGFRCDMAHMVPVEFWAWAIANVKETYPGTVFIAEIYDIPLYRRYIYDAGFDYLYDKVNLYDTLRAIQTSNCSAAQLTSCWQTVDGIAPYMLNFLENHDEQRYASRQYAGDASLATPALVVSAFISTGPMMIYAGQEIGEPAADAEGYSGLDGRTTIFDYWSIPTLRRYLNNGACNGPLTPAEEKLRALYRRILRLCNSEDAIRQGDFFDLMYANYDNPTLDPHRQFVFLRHSSDETIMVAVNFANHPVSLQVNIPFHAFAHLDIPQGKAKARELLTGRVLTKTLCPTIPMAVDIEANGAAVWKIRHADIRPLRDADLKAKNP